MKKKMISDRPTHKPVTSSTSTDNEIVGRNHSGKRRSTIFFIPSFVYHAGLIAVITVAMMASCTPLQSGSQVVETKPPSVSYNYVTDADLIDANSKARVYCSQYAATPSMQGIVMENPDRTKTVTFECIQPMVTPPPVPSPPMRYSYSSDAELLQALHSAESYCARTGQIPASSIVTNSDGTRSLSFRCVPR